MSEERKIVQAAGQIGVWTLLSRVTGLLRDILIAGLFGAGAVTDAFFVAFRIPNLLRRLVREGASNAAIIPVVTEYMVHHSRADTQDMLRALLGATSGVLLVLTGVGMVCAAPLVRVFAPGFGPQALALTVALTEMTFVYLFCIGLLALATGVLHAQRHFSAPAFAPVLLNTAIIGCALGLSRVLAEPVFSLACGVALGGVLQVAWQLPAVSTPAELTEVSSISAACSRSPGSCRPSAIWGCSQARAGGCVTRRSGGLAACSSRSCSAPRPISSASW